MTRGMRGRCTLVALPSRQRCTAWGRSIPRPHAGSPAMRCGPWSRLHRLLMPRSGWPARVRCHSRWDAQRARSRHTSAPRSTSAITGAASLGATVRPHGPTGITSSIGPTAGQPSSRTSSPCAVRITERCTSRRGAFISLTELPWWSRLPDESARRWSLARGRRRPKCLRSDVTRGATGRTELQMEGGRNSVLANV